jgi:hypothetical protein
MKQAVKKKEFTKPSISDIKSQLGLVGKTKEDLSKSSADKPLEFIQMPKAFEAHPVLSVRFCDKVTFLPKFCVFDLTRHKIWCII